MSWRQPRAFALRLHASAAPPRGGLTQALGGRKAFGCFAFQHSELAGLGWRCSSVGFLQRCFFGQVRLARSHIACVMFAGFGSSVWHRSVFPRLMLSFLTGPAESFRVRVRAFPLRFSASLPGFHPHRHPPPPNNSFKPTPCRGVGHVLCATLAHVRRPDTGRLNSSVRWQKSVL